MSDFSFGSTPEPPQGILAEVVVERGPSPNKRFPVTAVASTIGRSPNNDIVINDPEISRRHSQILQQADGFAVEDLGSTNGTFVNGQRCVGVTAVHDGDTIELGDTVRLRFVYAGAGHQTAVPDDDEDTADLLPVQPPVSPPPQQNVAVDQYLDTSLPDEGFSQTSGVNRKVVGCGLAVVLLICMCGVLVIFLESYNQGQYLYCGGLRPFWEVVLGPFGFNPVCP